MSNETGYLALFFDAPLLSFGVGSKFDRRDTLGAPSRGAVTGLVAAALGIERGDRAGLERLAELKMSGIVFTDRPGVLLHDFHTVGGGNNPPAWSIPVSASGGGKGTVVTDRSYLADGKFGAVLSGGAVLLSEIDAALRDPVWGGWIGRKHCIPATPVAQGVFDCEAEALERLRKLGGSEALRIWDECPLETLNAVTRADVPVDFSIREFRLLAVTER